MSYFWDSYAVIELMSGNANYGKYSGEKVRITVFNLVEIYWFALHEYGLEAAREVYETYRKAAIEPDDETLWESVEMRKRSKRGKTSPTRTALAIHTPKGTG